MIFARTLLIGLSASLAILSPATRSLADPAIDALVQAIDPATLLGPPSAPGSAEERAELDQLRAIMRHRTADQLAQAQWDADHDDASAFAALLAPDGDLKRLPATAHLLDVVGDAADAAAAKAKAVFNRTRPYVLDPSLVGCPRSAASPNPSYPSGDATIGWAQAEVLAALAPGRAAAFEARGAELARHRLVCSLHFPSDVEAGRILGIAVARAVLAAPDLQPMVTAARAELEPRPRPGPPAPPR
jgi:acid phosphatase (class A)